MNIPYTELSREVLEALVRDFVLREGTDYGQCDYALSDKVAAVIAQLESGRALITFDPETESLNIVPASTKAAKE